LSSLARAQLLARVLISVLVPVSWLAPGEAVAEQSTARAGGPSAQQPARPAPEPGAAAGAIAAWREALELDLPAEVLGPGPALVAAGGRFAREGEALALVARALYDAGRGEEAHALLERAEPSETTRAEVELERVRLWILEDSLERALAFLRPGVPGGEPRRHADRPESWLHLGRALSRAGEPLAAEPYLRRFVELAPMHTEAPAALHMLAQTALQRGDAASAERFGERGQALASWHAYHRVRRLQIREHPRDPLPRLGLAQLLLQAKEFARARAVLDELLALAPEYAPGWFHLGEARRMLGDLAGAAEAYSRALALDPELALARYNRGVIALRAGREAEARADFETLVAGPHGADPELVAAHLALARLELRAGNRTAAEARYRRYVELGGADPLTPEERR